MEKRMITALAENLGRHVELSKSRLETLGMLMLGMISARTVNLANVAPERGAMGVAIASTYRRFQRFFQHVRLAADWAAPMIAALAGGAEKRTLVLDRTNWKIGGKDVNILVLAVATRHSQAPLMWIVLDRPGNSGAPERIALIRRYIATFGKGSIGMLLGDREFIGDTWFNYLIKEDIPFTIRLRGGMYATLPDGDRWRLSTLLTRPRRGRKTTATLTGVQASLDLAAKTPKGGEAVIVATNRPGHDALATWRKRWAIDLRRENDPPDRFLILLIFGNTKTRGLNFEDTRLTDPAKLHLLTAIIALAIAWAARAARTKLGFKAPPRKPHGYLAKSYFRTGFDFIRNRLRSDPQNARTEWINLKTARKTQGVV